MVVRDPGCWHPLRAEYNTTTSGVLPTRPASNTTNTTAKTGLIMSANVSVLIVGAGAIGAFYARYVNSERNLANQHASLWPVP